MFTPRLGSFTRRVGYSSSTPTALSSPQTISSPQPTAGQSNPTTPHYYVHLTPPLAPFRPSTFRPPQRFFTTTIPTRARPAVDNNGFGPKPQPQSTTNPHPDPTHSTTTIPATTATIHPMGGQRNPQPTHNNPSTQHSATNPTRLHLHHNQHPVTPTISSVYGPSRSNFAQRGSNFGFRSKHIQSPTTTPSTTTHHHHLHPLGSTSPHSPYPNPVSTRTIRLNSTLRNPHHHHHHSPLNNHHRRHHPIPLTTPSPRTTSTPIITTQRRNLFGIVQNIRHMDWDRVRRNKGEPFVWFEEYKLGRYRADQKRILFHSRRTGGIQPPFDQRRGKYMEEYEYLHILEKEREERFWRMNIWNKANVVRRAAIAYTFIFVISVWNKIQDWCTRLLSRSAILYRGWRWHRERRILPSFLFAIIRFPLAILIRWVTSFFLRVEFTRNWTLRDLDWAMQNKVSGEMYAKYRWPTKYSISKYVFAIWEPILNTFNHFHAMRLVWLNVFWPLMRRWWFHINDYKPYFGFMKFGLLSAILCVGAGAWTLIFSRFRYFENASYAYKADFGHNYVALMTRAVFADVLISMIEDGLIEIDPLTKGHDFEIHTRMKSAEFKYIDDEVERRCRENPLYREQLRLEGIPVTLDEFFGVSNIPLDVSPKDQVLYILRQYNDYGSITKQMLAMMKPLYEFTDERIRIMYSLGLCSERSWLNQLMGNISSPRIYLLAYRALINILGTRDGDTQDPSIQHGAMIRALTRKFDLTVLPPSPDQVYRMHEYDRPYALQFQQIPWDMWAQRWEIKQHLFHKKYHREKPSHQVDLYHGADPSSYDPLKHGDHQFFNNLPSVTNGPSDINLKGLGKAFFDPYLAVLLPAFHARPLDHEMVVLQKIKTDLIQLARIAPEFTDTIPTEYDPYEYKHYIAGFLRVYGVEKLNMWEKMMGRDFIFDAPDGLSPGTYDYRATKHAKWLWSQVLACVTEKIEGNVFISPMYYIEDTCPDLGKSDYRSKVDTINRFQFRNFLGRPDSEQQHRAKDYQLIDPYAEEYVMLFKQFKKDSRVWDFQNKDRLDPRVEHVHRTPGDDLGYWAGGQSTMPFLGISKYMEPTPMLNNIGMLITCAENLMTVNRTAKDVMRQRTDWELKQQRYDPFGPQYRQNDGSYANTPEEDPRYRMSPGPDMMIPRGVGLGAHGQQIASGRTILPTEVTLKSARKFESELSSQLGNGQFRKDMDSLKTMVSGASITNPYEQHKNKATYFGVQGLHAAGGDETTISKTKTIVNQDGTKTKVVVNEPILSTAAHLKEAEKELLYRLQDSLQASNVNMNRLPSQTLSSVGLANTTMSRVTQLPTPGNWHTPEDEAKMYHHQQPSQQQQATNLSSVSSFHQTNRHQLQRILTDSDMSPTGQHNSILDNLVSLSQRHPQQQQHQFDLGNNNNQQHQDIYHSLLRKPAAPRSSYEARTTTGDMAYTPQQQHMSRGSLNQIMDPSHYPNDVAPLVQKYHRALELHLSDPFKYPNPLPPRQPHDRKAFLEDTKDEYEMYGQIGHDSPPM